MRFTLLGTGTSTGVPSVACDCETCSSSDPRDRRLRTSLLVQSDSTTVIIDTSMDFRQQMLTHKVMDIDGVVYTHHHFDHIGGFDDLRPYSFRSGKPVAVHAMQETIDVLRTTFPYAFGLVRPTGASVPSINLHVIDTAPFMIGDIPLQPIPMSHGGMPVLGFRIGDVAYCTDTNHIPPSSRNMLRGLHTLVIDGLRWQEHPTHFTIDQALGVIDDVKPEQAFLTHIAHQVLHKEAEAYLPEHVDLAWDGLTITR
jgi:phosphoribosyl 1,2-cyclic phosphate phosphodiesterase